MHAPVRIRAERRCGQLIKEMRQRKQVVYAPVAKRDDLADDAPITDFEDNDADFE